MIAALFVDGAGIYASRDDVEPWDVSRDARLYRGPWPVVAHPPCGRWCRMAHLVERVHGHRVGDDGGTFESALRSVLEYGGVLEHPAWSLAWESFGLVAPEQRGWQRALDGYWVATVDQAAYGHRARKSTWLLAASRRPGWVPPPMRWTKAAGSAWVGWGHGSAKHRGISAGRERVSKRAASATPPEFAAALIAIAQSTRD